MALTFTVEDGSGLADATSYVSVAEADDLSELNVNNDATWAALTTAQKENLLMYATKALDVRTKWNGARMTATQALNWPRSGMVDESGNALSESAVPFNVRLAVVEVAKWSMTTDKISADSPENVIREVKVDSINIQFADASRLAQLAYTLPSIVADLLRGLGTVRDIGRKVTFGRAVV